MTNLDLDQFLDPVDNEYMFLALGASPDKGLITGAHPAIFERLLGGFVVVQVAEYDTWTADHQLTRLLMFLDFLAFGRNDTCLNTWD